MSSSSQIQKSVLFTQEHGLQGKETICCGGGVFVLFLFAYFLLKIQTHSHALCWRHIHSLQGSSAHSPERVSPMECGSLWSSCSLTCVHIWMWCYTANQKGPEGPSLPRCPWPYLDTNKLPLGRWLSLTLPSQAWPTQLTHQPRLLPQGQVH